MKILTLSQYLTPRDGWGTSAGNTVRGLVDRGHDVLSLVQTVDPALPFVQKAVLPGALKTLEQPLHWWKTAKAVDRAITEWTPDVIHVLNEPYALGIALLSLWRRLPPVAMTACGTYAVLPLFEWKTRWMMKRVYRILTHVFAISNYTQERILQALRTISPAFAANVSRKMNVWTLGIESPPVLPPRVKRPEKRLLFVGGIKPRKGIREIIDACGELKRTSSVPLHLDLIGYSPPCAYLDSLHECVRALGLETAVTFHGHVSDLELTQAYANADCFLMLSTSHGHHFEGFGLVFLEANARGIPVIGPRDSGCEDAIAEERSGYLVTPGNPQEVAERLRWILEEERIQPEECKVWAAEHRISRQAEEAETVYRSMLR